MYFTPVQSDQLYTWSEQIEDQAHRRLEKTPSSSFAPTAPTQSNPARLVDRALQTLWQAWVQMRRRSRSWPQVLSVGELPGPAAANGLRPAGRSPTDHRFSGQLPPSSRDLRRDQRDQSRTFAPPRAALLRVRHEPRIGRPSRTDRYEVERRASCQYGRKLARRRSTVVGHYGGS
jgi:hypothetical protein